MRKHAGMSTPAETVIERFGGAQKVADAIGIDVSNVHRWKYPKGRGGSEGLVPTSRMRDVLDAATKLGVTLTADDLIPPSKPAEGDAPKTEAA